MQFVDHGDNIETAVPVAYFVPSREDFSFGIVLFSESEASSHNIFYTQLVGQNGKIAGFEKFWLPAGKKDLYQIYDRKPVNIKGEPEIVFHLSGNQYICGTMSGIRIQLMKILPKVADRPLIAYSVSRACNHKKLINQNAVKAYNYLSDTVTVGASNIWRDVSIVLPIVRSLIRRQLENILRQSQVIRFTDSLICADEYILFDDEDRSIAGMLDEQALVSEVLHKVPTEIAPDRIRLLQFSAFRRIISVDSGLYGPYHLIFPTDNAIYKQGSRRDMIQMQVNSARLGAFVRARLGRLPASTSGIEFFTRVEPSMMSRNLHVYWRPSSRNSLLYSGKRDYRSVSIEVEGVKVQGNIRKSET